MANKNRKCKWCKTYHLADSGVKVPSGWFCSMDHCLEFVKEAQNKARSKQIAKSKQVQVKEGKAARKAKREADRNDYKKQFKLTKEVVQRWAGGIRDAGKPCISCGTTNDIQYCGGHYKTAGGNPELALDTRNIHRQCNKRCNCELSGNIHGAMNTIGYTQGLINEFGQEYVDWLNSYHPPKNYTCEQLREIRSYYAKLTRDKSKDDSGRPRF